MKIKLTEKNYVKIQRELDKVQSRARVRVASVYNLVDVCDRATRHLGLSKKLMNGVKIHADCFAEKYASGYKFTPQSTLFNAEFKNGSWTITNIYRGTAIDSDYGIKIALTPEAEKSIIGKYICCR